MFNAPTRQPAVSPDQSAPPAPEAGTHNDSTFQPAPLAWLLMNWSARRSKATGQAGEPFEDHIDGLA